MEGIDGSGKTTLSKGLADELTSRGYVVHVTAEPTDGPIGTLIRNTNLHNTRAEALLFVADRSVHTQDIVSRVKSGEIVICDRYYASTLAYQSAADDKDIDMEWLQNLNESVTSKPDLTFLLDLDPEVGSERVDKRGERSRFERLEYQKRVRDNYLRIADEKGFVIVDASHTADEIRSEVLTRILEKLR